MSQCKVRPLTITSANNLGRLRVVEGLNRHHMDGTPALVEEPSIASILEFGGRLTTTSEVFGRLIDRLTL